MQPVHRRALRAAALVVPLAAPLTFVSTVRQGIATPALHARRYLPGIVNTHMHWQEERQPGMPQPGDR